MRLYWRYKKDGKWTWMPAYYGPRLNDDGDITGWIVTPEEEE